VLECRAGNSGASPAARPGLSGSPTAALASAGASGLRISEETAENGIVGASGEFVREGLASVGAPGELLPVGGSGLLVFGAFQSLFCCQPHHPITITISCTCYPASGQVGDSERAHGWSQSLHSFPLPGASWPHGGRLSNCWVPC
jgi:hypothetical protein